jgi:hypothetical protein
MATKRVGKTYGIDLMKQLAFNPNANSFKVSESGFDIGTILGDISAGKSCGANVPVIVVNTAAAWGYVKFGPTNPAAPTGIADGIGIPPNGFVVLSSGANSFIRSSAATIGAYVANGQTISTGSDQSAV